jgi:peptide/nickel transport system permease protein
MSMLFLPPGIGHILIGRWKVGLVFLASVATEMTILYLAIIRGRLAWFVGPAKYWFSTVAWFIIVGLIWIVSAVNLGHSLKERVFGQSEGYWHIVRRRLAKDAKGIMGSVIIFLVIHVALFSPFLASSDPLNMDFYNSLTEPSSFHPLGTDNLGRDVLDRIIYGSRVALGIGVVATLLNVMFGGLLGLLAGFLGGATDALIMRFLEITNAIPFLVLVLLVVSLWGSGVGILMVVLGILGLWPARIIRSEVISIRGADFVLASRAIGASCFHLVFTQILPNCLASLIVVATMNIGTNIITVASLSFLGFGVPPPTPSWGAMLKQAQDFISTAWWLAFFPGVSIALTVFSFSLLGDSLRDVLDPRLK